MHKSFTGEARRPRNINLSGRNKNPWANLPASSTANSAAHSNTLANAQAERERRQRERDRIAQTRTVQRVARGRADRKKIRAEWRALWDSHELELTSSGIYSSSGSLAVSALSSQSHSKFGAQQIPSREAYGSREQLVSQLQLLVFFAQAADRADRIRIAYFGKPLKECLGDQADGITARETRLLLRLGVLSIQAVRSAEHDNDDLELRAKLLRLIGFLARSIPREVAAKASDAYFQLFADLIESRPGPNDALDDLIVEDILALLTQITSETITAYTSFSTRILGLPDIESRLGTRALNVIFDSINYKLLASALALFLSESPTKPSLDNSDKRLWLLARFIYAHDHALKGQADISTDEDYVGVVSSLLSSLVDEISMRVNLEDTIMDMSNESSQRQATQPLPAFVQEQIKSLVQQSRVSNLLAQTVAGEQDRDNAGHAQALASYALTLLRVFPGKAEDIRSWLFMGTGATQSIRGSRVSPIRYFWDSTRKTSLYLRISRDQKQVLPSLRPPTADLGYKNTSDLELDLNAWTKDWQIVLLFFELYTFILKYMDDEEFLSGGEQTGTVSAGAGQLWTKEGALPSRDVRELTVFLKHLAFTLYWNASDLDNSEAPADEESIRSYFATQDISKPIKMAVQKPTEQGFAGSAGIAQKHLKGLVTGLLRQIHERDSRRRFLPKDHWLMTTSFDMTGFIPAVVAEEEKRHMISDDGADEDEEDENDDMLDISDSRRRSSHYMTGSIAREAQRTEQLKRKQAKAARRRIIESVAPRLEILRNLPFFIPFDTRVQIFRQFIYNDQLRRRGGVTDADQWRMSTMHSAGFGADGRQAGAEIISRHHADIERNRVFESAFDQYYMLGEGLKEPIQISFIDQFGSVEAGIDGGGVTKEFLTSVTNEAFDPTGDLEMFVENDHHLLYPNPGIIEEKKELLRTVGFREGSTDWRSSLAEVLQRYEFLGRIIGKCMYEGILVDVNFAGFFLLKWALTGGTTAASNESAYKPNLNDLRDLDEGLYQGLLQLKNYPGNVEDFSLNFSITDTIKLPQTDATRHIKSIDHDLIPSGSTTPVTNRNRLYYIYQVSRHRLLQQQYYQTRAFLQGLGQMISPTWLSMFNQHELQTLVSGDTSGEIDIDDLRSHTQYGGLYVIGDDHQEHPVIRMFWDVMKSLPHADRRKVIKFVTSTPRAPLGGFGHLNPPFSIRDSGGSDGEDVRLPSTSTCVNLLKLPRYRSREKLKEKLLYSVESGAGFDLS